MYALPAFGPNTPKRSAFLLCFRNASLLAFANLSRHFSAHPKSIFTLLLRVVTAPFSRTVVSSWLSCVYHSISRLLPYASSCAASQLPSLQPLPPNSSPNSLSILTLFYCHFLRWCFIRALHLACGGRVYLDMLAVSHFCDIWIFWLRSMIVTWPSMMALRRRQQPLWKMMSCRDSLVWI